MKKMIKSFGFVVLCAATILVTGCINDGEPLPADDNADAGVPADSEPDATPVPPDATPPPVIPNLTFTADPGTIPVGQSSTLTWSSNAAHCVGSWGPEWLYVNGSKSVNPTETTTYWLACYASEANGGLKVVKSVTVTVNPAPALVCHGLYVTFTAAAKDDIDHCTGWSATGTGTSLPVALQVGGANGVDGVCAITCNRKVTGETMLPEHVSGVWLSGGTADVPRWTTAGCKRLPDHPASEPNQAGGTWDKRCDLY